MPIVKVYIWYPKVGNSEISAALASDVGHVSISLGNTYISHRPMPEGDSDNSTVDEINRAEKLVQLSESDSEISDDTKQYISLKAVSSTSSLGFQDNYSLEKERKGREADIVYKIYGLKIDKMLATYRERAPALKYHPIKENCSKIVAEILLASFDENTASELRERAIIRAGSSRGVALALKNLPKLLSKPKLLNPSWYGQIVFMSLASWILTKSIPGLWMEFVWTPHQVGYLIQGFEQTLSGLQRTQSFFRSIFRSEKLFEKYNIKVVQAVPSNHNNLE